MKSHSIQYLRGFAATAIVIFHLQIQLQRFQYNGPFPNWLSAGVDIFFVISGYIMWSTTINRDVGAIEFMARRLIRIVPLYWTITTFFVVVLLVSPNVFQTSAFDFRHVVSSYLFLPYEHPVTHTLEPVVIPGWTLNYEMFFYVLFALWLNTNGKIRLIGILMMFIAIAASRFVADSDILKFYTSSLILEFGFGVAIAYLVSKKIYLPRYFIFAAPLLFLATVCVPDYTTVRETRFILWGLPAAFLVFSAVSYEQTTPLKPRWQLELIGDASYSIYLVHGVALAAIGQCWRRFAPYDSVTGLASFCIFATASSLMLGVGLYWFYERPVEALGKSSSGAPFRGRGSSALRALNDGTARRLSRLGPPAPRLVR